MNIVERSSGFWVVDALGVVNTEPFDTHQQARKWINRRIKVHQVSPRNPNMKGVYECVNPKQRIKGKYRRLKNGEILRKGDYSAFSRINEYPTGEWLLVKLRKTPMVVNYNNDDLKLYFYRRIHSSPLGFRNHSIQVISEA